MHHESSQSLLKWARNILLLSDIGFPVHDKLFRTWSKKFRLVFFCYVAIQKYALMPEDVKFSDFYLIVSKTSIFENFIWEDPHIPLASVVSRPPHFSSNPRPWLWRHKRIGLVPVFVHLFQFRHHRHTYWIDCKKYPSYLQCRRTTYPVCISYTTSTAANYVTVIKTLTKSFGPHSPSLDHPDG